MPKHKKKQAVFVCDRTLYYNLDDGDIDFNKPQYGENYKVIKKGTTFYCPSLIDESVFDFSTLYDTAICLIPKSKLFALNFSTLNEAKENGIVRKIEKDGK